MELRLAPVWPWPATAILGTLLVAFALWTYPPTTPRRLLLVALRLLAIATALFAFARPALEFKKVVEQSSTLVLLYDKSRSMNLKDMWRNQSRWTVLRDMAKEAEPDLVELKKKVQIQQFLFARKISELSPDAWDKTPDGNQTALGDALDDLSTRYGENRIAGILVLSDGANNAGVDPSEVRRQLAGRNIPVHTFGFGSETATEQVRDIVPTKIDASPTAFRKNKLPIRAEFLTAGFAGQRIPVKLSFDGEEKSRGELKPIGDGQKGVVELVGVPEKAGDVKVTIEAEPQPGELLANNNAISTYVSVRADGLSVLHLEGKYRFWEPKFLRRAIDQSPDIDLTQVFLLDTAGKANDLPADLFETGKFDVVILGDLAAAKIPPEQMDKLLRLLKSGAGLLMVGGYESFGGGGWEQTGLAEYLPVEMRPADQQLDGELRFSPTPAGLRHFVLRLAPDAAANVKLWQRLRPLDGANSWAGLRRNALVLAETPEQVPLLVAQEVGKTRSLAFAADTTWRWSMKNKEGKGAHARFWRQLILWLAHREDVSGTQVRLKLDRRRVASGDRLPIEVFIEKTEGAAPPNLRVEATVRLGDNPPTAVSLVRQGDHFVGSVAGIDAAGDYQVSAAAFNGAESIGSANAKFLVYDDDQELRQLAADFDALRKLSADTGGEFHTAEEFPKFVKSLKSRDLNQEVTKPVLERLWDRWELLALFVAALTVEWFIRKRSGLV